MIAPRYVSVTLLHAAINAAADVLDDPIDSVALRGEHAVVTAGSRTALIRFHHSASHDENGVQLLGSDSWSASVESVSATPVSRLVRLWRAVTRQR